VSHESSFVRPTRRCLDDLSLAVPDLGRRLHELEHPIILKGQLLPQQVAAGGAERIVSIHERVWFKIKSSSWRAAAGELPLVSPANSIAQRWWIVAAGSRQQDSPQHDFYARLSEENERDSDALLPTAWDLDRLDGESAVYAVRIVHALIRRAAAESMLNSDIRTLTMGHRDVRVRVRMLNDQRVYLAIGAVGQIDSSFMTTLLSAFPEIDADDWMPEPSDNLDLTPMAGEILWSAMISPQAQQDLLTRSSEQD
jgi:hypothetical protein